MARTRYFPHLAGTLVLASAGAVGMLNKWEPAKGSPDAQLVVYADKLAQGLPSVCNGITKHVATIPVVVGEKWTQQMCDTQQELAIEKVQTQVAMCFKVLPPQSVFDMAFDHAWNNGYFATCSSQSMQNWNKHKWKEGCRLLTFTPTGEPNWSSVSQGRFYLMVNQNTSLFKVFTTEVLTE